jgi:hypothetical protein
VVESVMSPSELSAVKRAASTVAVAEPREPVIAAGFATGVAPQNPSFCVVAVPILLPVVEPSTTSDASVTHLLQLVEAQDFD